MKIIKTFEEWSPVFNRTLQGAAALAKATNKPHQKRQSIEDYANRSIREKEFSIVQLKALRGTEDTEVIGDINTHVVLVHDPKFILKPIEEFKKYNLVSVFFGFAANAHRPGTVPRLPYFSIPVVYKHTKSVEDGKVTPMDITAHRMITFTKEGDVYLTLREKFTEGSGNKVKFVDRASIENFMAMAIQAITSSPEGNESEVVSDEWGVEQKGMTHDKKCILAAIQSIVLDRDMRSFTI